jgi:hypothetical protein
LTRSSAGNDKPEVESSLKVSQNPLGSDKVSFPGIMHVKAYLLDSIGDIWPSEGQVLKSASKTAIGCGICHRRSGFSRDFGTCVNRGGAGITITHAMVANDVQSVLALREEQIVPMALHSNSEEEVERAKIFHGKFYLQSCKDTLKECWRGGCEDYVVNI